MPSRQHRAWVPLLAATLVACTGEIGRPVSGTSKVKPWLADPSETGSKTMPDETAPGASEPGQEEGCEGTPLASAKRIVRLSFNQLANSMGTLVSSELAAKLVADNDIVDYEHRAFPPLQSPREGNSVTDATWKTMDSMAANAAQFVADNFAKLSSCGTNPTDACAQQYLLDLADRAFRRPASSAEKERLTKLYSSALRADAKASVSEAVQYGVYAILQSPQVVYRTELGSDWKTAGSLTSLEIASALSYFLTDNMPDAQLMAAASKGKLSTPDEIGAEVDRLLKTDAARKNLHGAVMSYFAYPQLEAVKIDDPAFTDGVRNSMYHEAELFLQNVLWKGVVNDLLLSKKTTLNASLARIYGVSIPAGAAADADGFAEVNMPEQRMGILTQAGFLATRSRPDKTSVVGRGLLVKNAFLCTETPPPPEGIADKIASIVSANPDASERELANIRATTSPCYGCHQTFDAYGLALDSFDVIGRYRKSDSKGRAIDTSVTLPQQVGGGMAKNAVEVAQQLADNGSFAVCMGRNFINYALADVSAGAADLGSCAVQEVTQSFEKSDGTFSSLVRSVATSQSFFARSRGME